MSIYLIKKLLSLYLYQLWQNMNIEFLTLLVVVALVSQFEMSQANVPKVRHWSIPQVSSFLQPNLHLSKLAANAFFFFFNEAAFKIITVVQ